MTSPHDATLRAFEEKLAAREPVCYELTLYVNGASDLSARAVANARQLLEANLSGQYRLAIVDVHEDPTALLSSRVVAAPTLVKRLPLPVRMLVGDLSRSERVLMALGLPVVAAPPSTVG